MTYKVREAVVRYRKVRDVIKTIKSAEDVYRFFQKRFKGETREVFFCLYLSQHNGILCFEKASMGTSIGTLVDIKGIVRTAILVGAESVIFILIQNQSHKCAQRPLWLSDRRTRSRGSENRIHSPKVIQEKDMSIVVNSAP